MSERTAIIFITVILLFYCINDIFSLLGYIETSDSIEKIQSEVDSLYDEALLRQEQEFENTQDRIEALMRLKNSIERI